MPSAKTVDADVASANWATLLAFVSHGHDVIITKDERPVARLVSIDEPVVRGEACSR